MDLKLKVTLNDHNQLLTRFPHMHSGATLSTPAFYAPPQPQPDNPQKATKFHNFIISSNIGRFAKFFYWHI